MNIPQFLFAENKTEAPGAQFIVSTRIDCIGMVYKGAIETNAPQAQVPGYNIHILIVREDLDYSSTPTSTATAMAAFYLKERIQKNLKYYERYRTAQ